MLLILRGIWGVGILRSICWLLLVLIKGRLAGGILLVGLLRRSCVEGVLLSRSHGPAGITHQLIIVDLSLLEEVLRRASLHL
jgi:hypothetical protein